MRSFTNAITVMQNAVRQDRVNVAGLVELRSVGPRRPHLYGALPATAALARLPGEKPVCSPERTCMQRGAWHCSAQLHAHGRSARRCAARIS